MKLQLRAALTAWAAISVLLFASVSAQGTSGVLNGQVVDASGGAMPGVTVTATNPATGASRVATTDAEGVYQLTALPIGTDTSPINSTASRP